MRTDRVVLVLVSIAVAAIYLLTAGRGDMDDANNDVSSAAFGAWRIADAGQPWVDDAAGRRFEPVPDRSWVGVNERTGREVMVRSPGVIAAAVPASWIARRLGQHDFGPGPELVTAALLTTLSGLLLYLALETLGRATSTLVALAFALATPVWSVNANALWPHVLTVLGITGMAWAARTERWWLVGVLGGVALWGRLHTALVVAVLGLGLAVVRRRPGIALRIAVTSGAAMALASVWSWWHYDSWVPSGGYGGAAAFRVVDGSQDIGATEGVLENQLGMWVSPGYGILVWTPVLLLLLPGVARRWRQVPDWALLLLAGGFVYTIVQAQINIFSGGAGFWGYRHGLEFLACATPAVAFSLRGTSRRLLRIVSVVLAVQLAAIALGAMFDGGYVSPTRAWRTNALVEIVTQAPATAALGLVLAAAALGAGTVVARRLPTDPTPPTTPTDEAQEARETHQPA
jgi:hypothetical protein